MPADPDHPADLDRMVRDVAAEIAANAARIEADADAKDETATPGPFGLAIATADGRLYTAGAVTTLFPIQSISKVFALDVAMRAIGDDVFDRVGREPSGDPFNSIVDLERNRGKPRNPFVNAGALAIADMLVEHCPGDRDTGAVVALIERRIGHPVTLDAGVMASEEEAGDLNRAMLYFMRHHGNLHVGIDDVMAQYIRQCAIALDCRDLARAGLFLSDTGRRDDDRDADATAKRMRRILALMTTCGNYDGSGDFAYRVGLPAKSGVGGGILAIVPETAAIAVWSPNLDQHGNSILGVHALEMLCDRTGWSAFVRG